MYADTMKKLRECFRYERRGKPKCRGLILHENAPPDKSFASLDAVNRDGFREISHPVYSLYLFRD